MAAQGIGFLHVDGHCHYRVFCGTCNADLRAWEPVEEGDLSSAEVDDLSADLQVDRWPVLTDAEVETDLPTNEVFGVNAFQVAGEGFECAECGGVAVDILAAAEAAVTALDAVGTRLDPVEELTVGLLEGPSYLENSWTIPWGAVEPPSAYQLYGNIPPDPGVVVSSGDLAWFVEAMEGFQDRPMPTYTNQQGAIRIEGDPGWDLYVHPLVP